MKSFLFLLAVSFTVSALLPEASSIRTHLDNLMDSSPTFNVQQYGASADVITDNSKDTVSSLMPEASSIGTNLDNIMDSSPVFNDQEYGAKVDGSRDNGKVTVSSLMPDESSIPTDLDNRMDSSPVFNDQQYGAKADGIGDNSKVTTSSPMPEESSVRPDLDDIMDSSPVFNDQQYGAKADGFTDNNEVAVSSMWPERSSIAADLDNKIDSSLMFNVQSYGAKGDGITDNGKAFMAAWNAACSSTGSSTVYIPKGKFLVSPVSFRGPCKSANIMVQIIGDLIAPTDSSLWTGDSGLYWLQFTKVDGLTINGGGSLDGKGASWWNSKCPNGQQCKPGPASLHLLGTTETVVQDITSVDSKQFHISLDSCDNVVVEGLTIQAPEESPNTDGIHVSSTNVNLRNLVIGTGDDCIGILEGTSNLAIEQVTCGPGHGISIGSLGKYPSAHGVTNVTVNGVNFRGTQNGVRIKTLQGGKGFATGLTFENIQMDNVNNPIIIDQYYCPHCVAQESGMNVQITDVLYKNITGTSATKQAINLACSKSFPCKGITVQDVNLNYGDEEAQSSCQNANGITVKSVKPPLDC